MCIYSSDARTDRDQHSCSYTHTALAQRSIHPKLEVVRNVKPLLKIEKHRRNHKTLLRREMARSIKHGSTRPQF